SVSLAAPDGTQQVVGGTPVTLVATLTLPSGVDNPGMMDFRLDGASVGAYDIVDGTAEFTLPRYLPEGSYEVTAVSLLDDYRITGGTSNPVTITVLPAPVLPELDTPVITGTLALGE